MPKVEPIPLGTLLPDSTSIDGPDRPWRFGLIVTHSGREAVFATACDGRELFVQGIVASIARALGLPVPPCFLVLASRMSILDHPSANPFFMFACKAGPHPTLAAFARNIATVSDILLKGKRETANRMIILDEWTQNPARDRTAALVDPQVGLRFVDHHNSLPNASEPAEQLRNWVFEVANSTMTELDTADCERIFRPALVIFLTSTWARLLIRCQRLAPTNKSKLG